MEIKNFQKFEEVDPGRLLGGLTINGVGFHAEAVRVRVNSAGLQEFDYKDEPFTGDGSEPFPVGQGILDNMYAFDAEGPWQTIEIEGFPGDWVLFITPHKD